MATIFVGGSRTITRLPDAFAERLKNIVQGKHAVVVGDAEGVDVAVHKYLYNLGAKEVEVCFSGKSPRNNPAGFPVHKITTSTALNGYQFHAAKDRAMAQMADYGLMAWDGKSPGSALNILRLVNSNKPSVLFNCEQNQFREFRTEQDWLSFIGELDSSIVEALSKRAVESEWISLAKPNGMSG